jgi:hypothetical protein
LRFEASAEESTSVVADSTPDATTAAPQTSGEEQKGLWWIKANQGHSMKVCMILQPRGLSIESDDSQTIE